MKAICHEFVLFTCCNAIFDIVPCYLKNNHRRRFRAWLAHGLFCRYISSQYTMPVILGNASKVAEKIASGNMAVIGRFVSSSDADKIEI